jgi:hypothetical protein
VFGYLITNATDIGVVLFTAIVTRWFVIIEGIHVAVIATRFIVLVVISFTVCNNNPGFIFVFFTDRIHVQMNEFSPYKNTSVFNSHVP